MEIQQGMPTEDGRYVAFIADRVYKIWATPTIAVFHKGHWDIGRSVYAWLGPLPMGKIEDLWPTKLDWFPQRTNEESQIEDWPGVSEINARIPKCSICGLPQWDTPSGMVCKNGHGGADSRFEPIDGLEYDL